MTEKRAFLYNAGFALVTYTLYDADGVVLGVGAVQAPAFGEPGEEGDTVFQRVRIKRE